MKHFASWGLLFGAALWIGLVAAMGSSMDWLLFGATLSLPVLIARPFWVVYLYAFLLPVESLVAIGSLGSVNKYIGLAMLAGLVLHIYRKRPGMKQAIKACLPMALFLVYATLSFLWSADSTTSVSTAITLWGLFLILLFSQAAANEELDPTLVVWFYSVSAVVVAAFSLTTFFGGQLYHGVSRMTLMSDSGYSDPNHFASALLLPFFWLLGSGDRRCPPVLRTGAVLLLTVSLILSGSRGTLVAAAVGAGYLVFGRKDKATSWMVIAVGVGAALVAVFGSAAVLERYDLEAILNGDGSGRTVIWQIGFQAFGEHWLGGWGLGAFPKAFNALVYETNYSRWVGLDRPAHNIYLSTAVELGSVGLMLLLSGMANLFGRPKRGESPEAHSVRAAVLALCVSSVFLGTFTYKYFWFALALPIAMDIYLARRGQGSLCESST